MVQAAFQNIIINGEPYVYRDEDLDSRWTQYLATIRVKFGQKTGPIWVDEIRVPTGISAERWKESLHNLQSQLEEIRKRSFNRTFFRFERRMPGIVESQIRGSPRLKVLARSTVHAGKDDDDVEAGRPYARGLAYAYGVKPAEIIPLPYLQTRVVDCDLFDEKPESIKRRLVLSEEGMPLIAGRDYCSSLEAYEPEYLGAAKAFIDKNKSKIDEALALLSGHHPDLNATNLRLIFYDLIDIEFHVYDRADLLQDAAASHLVGASQESALKEALGTWNTDFAFSKVGVWGWELMSRWKDVPLETQGFGPLQIIPGLALAAYQDADLSRPYLSTGLCPEDFADTNHVINASFDPNKMFVIKAMTWDLELKQLKTLNGLTAPITAPPHFQSDKAAREAALLVGAYNLVQFPEQTEETVQMLLGARFDVMLTSLYLVGDIFGLEPQFEGIHKERKAKCPDQSFGYFRNKNQPGDVCLFSD